MLYFTTVFSTQLTMHFQLILTVCLATLPSQVFGGVIFRDAEDSETCESEGCHNTANHILKWLNPEVDPCEDFYEFACGNWRNLPVDKRANMSVGARGSLVETFIPVLIKDPSKTNGKLYFEKLRNFMITCMDEDTIHSLGVTPIRKLMQKAGGWPVLDADWSEEHWDFINAEITLGGVLIDVVLAENSSDTTYLIRLRPSILLFIYTLNYNKLVEGLENESTKDYYDTMVDVAVALGADKEVAEQSMKEVLEFETAFVMEMENTRPSGKRTTTLKEFQEAVPSMNLTKLLMVYLPESLNLLPEENIIGNTDFFLVLEKIMNQYSPKTFANYMMSKAVYPLLAYVHHDLKITWHKDYKYEEIGKGESRFDYCTNVVERSSLGPAMAAYLGTLYADASKVASEMTKVMIDELAKEVEETDWLDEVRRKEAAKDIHEIKINVGFPQKITDLDELDKLYEGYEIDTSNFFDAMIYDKKWIQQRNLDRLHKKITNDEFDKMGWTYYMVKGLKESAHYDVMNKIIDVSGPMLYLFPLFSPESPAYVNYGHAGIFVAHELIHALDFNVVPEENYLLGINMKNQLGSNQTKHIYAQKKQCFTDFYSSINDTKTTNLNLNGSFTEREDIADNGGLRLSLRAYRTFANQLGSPERKLPRLQQYSIEQLFMISVANVFCEIPYKEKRIMQLYYDPHSPFEFRVIGMMMNSPYFSEIFNCDKKDTMNPPDKCEVW